MKIRPVPKYAPPAYPDRLRTDHDPALLSRHVPAAWLRSEIVAGALATLVVGGCSKNEPKGDAVTVNRGFQEQRVFETSARSGVERPADAKVAPVFNHGPGWGAVGCVVMSPPVFVSESEAREIIEGELGKAGIGIGERDVRVEGVYLDRTHLHFAASAGAESAERSETEHNVQPLVLDGWDKETRLGYQYVSREDYSSSVQMHYLSSVRYFKTLKVAEQIREKLVRNGSINAAVFYDPLSDGKEAERMTEALSMENQKGDARDKDTVTKLQAGLQAAWAKGSTDPRFLLRLQVRDFIAWAKREGVLK
ncbi:MAG: hypothetical protein HY897_22980 [Deltaproteobacteria bacterium]|nr:hypothetical protein [Deltaproteobacteria bacterium]